MYRPIKLTDQRKTNVTAERYSEYILNQENSRIVASYSPEPSPAWEVYYYSQLVHIDQTIYDTTRIDHLIYVSNLPNQISLMTLRMRRLDKTQTKTPPDKCWDTLRIGVHRFFTRIDQFIYVSSYNKWWSSTSSPKSRENFILNPNCECTNNGGLPLVSN